jgi:hypothetical protein
MNNGLMALLRHVVDSLRKEARCSYGDDHRASVEGGADELVAINLQDAGIIFNPGLLLCVSHGQVLRFCCLDTFVDIRGLEQPAEAARNGR